MEVSWQMIVSGFLGGCAAELVHWFRMRKELHKGLPDWAKSWLYWTVTIIMAIAGGLLVHLHGIDSNPILGVCAVEMIVARKCRIEARFSRFGGA